MKNIIPLAPIDHIFTGTGSYPIEFVFAYMDLLDADKLHKSLLDTTRIFPPMDSQLCLLEESRYGFDLDKKGLEFEVVNDTDSFSESTNRLKYIAPVDTKVGSPLTRIRLTQTPYGSVLGVSISHSIVDGFSYFYFMASWAATFHGKPVFPPVIEREPLIPKKFDPKTLAKDDILNEAGLFLDMKRRSIPREKLIWETMHFSSQELKERIGELQEKTDKRLSFNDIVTTQCAKKFILKWHKGKNDVQTYISCPVDFRRIYPNFPQTYFGNAVALATVSIPFNRFQKIEEQEMAEWIRQRIGQVDQSYIDRSMQVLWDLRKQEGLPIFENIHVMDPSNGILVTNLSRLPVNDIVFNAGPPVAYDILTPAQRGGVVLPVEDGLEVRVCYPME
jgi:shikimate O-hydroxycinnamoyltransferase